MGDIIQYNRAARRMMERKNRKAMEELGKLNREVTSMSHVDMSEMKVPMIVVFNRPVDYPIGIMARLFEMDHPTNIVVRYDDMQQARDDAKIAGFQTLIPRSDTDDPHIVETYMR